MRLFWLRLLARVGGVVAFFGRKAPEMGHFHFSVSFSSGFSGCFVRVFPAGVLPLLEAAGSGQCAALDPGLARCAYRSWQRLLVHHPK